MQSCFVKSCVPALKLICVLFFKLYLFYNDYETSYRTYIDHARWHRCLRSDGLRVGGNRSARRKPTCLTLTWFDIFFILVGDEKAEEAIRDALQDVNDRIVEEMRTKGPLNFAESRTDNTLTPMSRSNTTVTEYQLQGLSRSRAEIAKMQTELGPRFRADYARTPAAQSEYSSMLIPDDDGDFSLSETPDLNIDLERLRTDSTIFGSSFDVRDNIRSETFVSGKLN